jgi:hypothetical protein
MLRQLHSASLSELQLRSPSCCRLAEEAHQSLDVFWATAARKNCSLRSDGTEETLVVAKAKQVPEHHVRVIESNSVPNDGGLSEGTRFPIVGMKPLMSLTLSVPPKLTPFDTATCPYLPSVLPPIEILSSPFGILRVASRCGEHSRI